MATITSTTATADVAQATALADIANTAPAAGQATYVDGRTTYTATVVSGENLTWTRQSPDHSRLQYVVSVTRTTSRSTKTFEVHVTREVGNFTSYALHDETALYASHVYNDNRNAVHAAEYDGYRIAAVQAATALEAQYAAQDDQDQPETAQAAVETPETTTTTTTAVEDTVITTHLDPATGGRVLDDKDRQALRQGPPPAQDDTEPSTGYLQSIQAMGKAAADVYARQDPYTPAEGYQDLEDRVQRAAQAWVLNYPLGDMDMDMSWIIAQAVLAETSSDAWPLRAFRSAGYPSTAPITLAVVARETQDHLEPFVLASLAVAGFIDQDGPEGQVRAYLSAVDTLRHMVPPQATV